MDGPEFDARKVDFGELMNRLATYRGEEAKAVEKYEEECKCGLR
ncbi:MAG TPA: hypothetical protein VN278_04065 [Methanosarcina sp.]|nr:hypothetical protein [Methanosarcina sp.]